MSAEAPLPAEACEPSSTPSAPMLSVEEALGHLLERARPLAERERVPLAAALGRVTARPLVAARDVPGHASSSMDGYAVVSGDLLAATPVPLRVVARVAAGAVPTRAIGPGEAARIFTGAPLPPGADAVVMQEDCHASGDTVVVRGPVSPGQHVRPRGNNVAAGEQVLAAGIRLRPQALGIAAALGQAELEAVRRLRVAVFSSGDELVEPGRALAPGCIYNSNRYTLHGLLAGLGCEAIDLGIVEDRLEATERALASAAERADVIVSSGGVSVGEEDHVRRALERRGRLELWRVAVKPGKPLAYGRIGSADFLGLPGNPVSTFVTFCLFVRPFILRRQGAEAVLPSPVPVRAGFEWPEPMRRREYVRARVTADDEGELWATLHPRQGSDVLASTVWAHGLVEIREGRTVARGDRVAYLSFAELLA